MCTIIPHRLTIVAILATLLVGVTGALASTARGGCCACVLVDEAMLSGPPPPEPIAALFCAAPASMNEEQAAEERCSDLGGDLKCLETGTSSTAISAECREALLDQDVACPQQAGAPLAGPWALAGLAVALGALGAAARRRR